MIAVEEYTATLKGKNGVSAAKPDTQRKAMKAINDFKEYLSQFDKPIPDESDIEAYRVKLEATDGSKGYQATRTKITYIRGYYAYNEERSKEATMTDETKREPETLGAIEPESAQASEEFSQCVDDGASTENIQASEEPETEMTAPNEPESLPEGETFGAVEPVKAEPNKRGRKNREKKVPVSVYLDGETYRVMNILSGLTHRTIGDIAASTLSEFAKKNAAKVDAKAAEVQAALDAVKKAMENFTLEY